jgi:hypothetical protein
LIYVDDLKKSIRVMEFLPERSNEAVWDVSVGPTTKITINGKEAQLADLQALRYAVFLDLECEFEVMEKPKPIRPQDEWKKFADNGKAVRIDATRAGRESRKRRAG